MKGKSEIPRAERETAFSELEDPGPQYIRYATGQAAAWSRAFVG